MDLMTINEYCEHYGDRIAWKIGDLTGEEPYGRRAGQFSACLDFDIDSHVFEDYAISRPYHVIARYLDHSFSIMLWKWGIWIAVRGRKIV